jgi:dipeptidyl aminopeptidase/acylaminoacyl peptidase
MLPAREAAPHRALQRRGCWPLRLGRHEAILHHRRPGRSGAGVAVLPTRLRCEEAYPLLQAIHGGPHTVVGDNWHYRWNNPLFARRARVTWPCGGVNYHGSSSFGHAFLDSITHRWGELELQDVEAATD